MAHASDEISEDDSSSIGTGDEIEDVESNSPSTTSNQDEDEQEIHDEGEDSDEPKETEQETNAASRKKQLRQELCWKHDYNDFMMGLLMNLFSLEELKKYLESSDTERPVTVRTNTLKTRRKELAQELINLGCQCGSC
ncbi:hypothetical protein SUGI_1507280 [Cryptomeria japonica]|uniref:Uncharacterized protein n=1 Tax=Cryptomeria japonica TaxID=3369 RepID=A0AAD3NT48_CRYJA|nr:hypothetical protein SUGI_1507280 [Cryptomeria japonica]